MMGLVENAMLFFSPFLNIEQTGKINAIWFSSFA